VGPDDITADRLSEIMGGEIGAIESTRIGDGLVGLNLRVQLLDAAPVGQQASRCGTTSEK
jgi:hypothetical protein